MRNPLELWRGETGPYRDYSQFQNLMDRFFADTTAWKNRTSTSAATLNPPCEVTEDKVHYHFKFDLPGMLKDQVKIELHENQLTVTGERKEEKKEDTKRSHFSEVSYGTFMRTFTLPQNVDAEKVEARFDNGVLNITIAKSEESKARQVNIK